MPEHGLVSRVARKISRVLLDAPVAQYVQPHLQYSTPPPVRLSDYPIRVAEVALFRLLRRNPPATPWRRRHILSWSTMDETQFDVRSDGRDTPQPLIYGVTAVWNEDDVIYATVRNLFRQGADRVFVIDNDSDDRTPIEAEAAGAEILRAPSDGVHREPRRTQWIRQCIADRTAEAGRDVWWIVIDADEFPRGPNGGTIRDLVQRTPPWVDIVGSRVLEHYPDASTHYEVRHHPLEQMPLARWYTSSYCIGGHWKHQLLHVRRPGALFPLQGQHTAGADDGRRVVESREALLTHQFPLRDPARTEAKLRLATAPSGRYATSPDSYPLHRIQQRLRKMPLVYSERYHLVPNELPRQRRCGVKVADWRDLVTGPEAKAPYEAGQI